MHRSLVSQLDGSEPNEIIPQWVIDCLLNNDVPSREAPKIGFYLLTADEKECPALPQGANRLSAHKLLKIRKVANFVVQKLELELPTKSKVEPLPPIAETSNNGNNEDNSSSSSASSDADNTAANGVKVATAAATTPTADEKVAPEHYIEILCNNKVVPPNINLATTRAFFWKSGDDLVLYYRINSEFLDTGSVGDKKGGGGSLKGSKSIKKPKIPKSIRALAKSKG